MGRKKRRGETQQLLLLLVECVFLLMLAGGTNSDGEVGCLFSKNLCNEEIESCYNDLAFGRCVRLQGGLLEEDLYQYNLEPEELDLLRTQLERLEYKGYKWVHDYTQCVMQILLDDLRYRLSNDVENLCKNLKWQSKDVFDGPSEVTTKDKDVKTFMAAERLEKSQEGPKPVAIVKFNPSRMNPHAEYADEFYYPPSDLAQVSGQLQHQATEEHQESATTPSEATTTIIPTKGGGEDVDDINNYDDYDVARLYDKLSAAGDNSLQAYRRGSRSLSSSKKSLDPTESDAYSKKKDSPGLPPEYLEALQDFLDSEASMYIEENSDDFGYSEDKKDRIKKPRLSEDYEKVHYKNYQPSRGLEDDILNDQSSASGVSAGINDQSEDDADDYVEENESRIESIDDAISIPKSIIDSLSHQDSAGAYGDGMMDTLLPLRPSDVIRPEEYEDLPLGSDLNDMFWGTELAGFKRRERYDVKKPGPPFSTNNYAFKAPSSAASDNEMDKSDPKDNEDVYLPVKKEISNSKFSTLSKTYENVDIDHVYIVFSQEIKSWDDGKRIVKQVATLIGLDPEEFNKGIRVGRAEVTFKVPNNSKNYNATDIVKQIDNVREDVRKKLNLEIIRAGIGDKRKLPSMLEMPRKSQMSSNVFGAMVAASTAAVTAAAIVILVIARRHAKSRAKLAGLRNPDPEASKDYQDLCRARMQGKQSDKLSESPRAFDFGRLIESGRSESNRSSTSSWGEEPAVASLDVATGHLVLSYMEEHLKNTDKLDEEWAALCSYEPDPCSTAIAEAEGNAECNRADAALPYDHSRVVLNDLANLNNSDYINASTITDHDPRNPAYIATQGPLPQTAPDFWQLIWEQGSVVVVMLTRLTEDGQAMCHRYWPEEGSELYHIYEVHLVSEHIWCDDYLVRSFYLKNLRTGETRTVTQFHFLAWPNNGVPGSIKTLLEFRRKVNKSYRGRSCPIIVHCSDGAGRTGAYCLIDMVLNRMTKGAKEIDIAATLEHIRDQRPGMVASKQQYEFVLMAVAEEVHAILKSLPIVADKLPLPPSTTSPAATSTATSKASSQRASTSSKSDK